MEQQLMDWVAVMSTIKEQNKAIQASVGSLEETKLMVVDLAGWKPTMEKTVAELRDEMGDLRQQVVQISRNPVLAIKPADLPTLLPTPPGAHQVQIKDEDRKPHFGDNGHGPVGHHENLLFWGKAVKKELSEMSLPAKGGVGEPEEGGTSSTFLHHDAAILAERLTITDSFGMACGRN
ncbi:hypothetical protein E2562_018219 [Oryza meyeriana var. granulata]|uniref:Uncharacterized protein n=1 Tax=Oryza meyeriana var. granulata TaxID=110450 RepID=A0A6G1CHS5_9ORYZ|nr:hypothetical protein E2562_018219 [Oryza meyeriana var. granulata]